MKRYVEIKEGIRKPILDLPFKTLVISDHDLDGFTAARFIETEWTYRASKQYTLYQVTNGLRGMEVLKFFNKQEIKNDMKVAEAILIVDISMTQELHDELVKLIYTENPNIKIIFVDHHRNSYEVKIRKGVQLYYNDKYCGAYLLHYLLNGTKPGPLTQCDVADKWDTFKWAQEDNIRIAAFNTLYNITDRTTFNNNLKMADNMPMNYLDSSDNFLKYVGYLHTKIYPFVNDAVTRATKTRKGLSIATLNLTVNKNIDRTSLPLMSYMIKQQGVDIIITLQKQEDNSYRVNLYSSADSFDCRDIVAPYGGGGHKGAAGCFIPNDYHLSRLQTTIKTKF